MKTKFKIAVSFMFILNSCSTLDIVHVTNPSAGTENGVYYALPMTIVTVEVPVTKITRKPGRCLCEDEEMMRLKGEIIDIVIKAKKEPEKAKKEPELKDKAWNACEELMFDATSSERYKLGDLIISSYPVPDSSKIFFVTNKKNVFKKNNLSFVLNELAVLHSAEIKAEDRTLDVITQVVGSVASVAGKFLKGTENDSSKLKGIKKSAELTPNKIFCNSLRVEFDKLVSAKSKLIQNENSQTETGTFSRQLEEIDKAQQAIIAQFTYVEERETNTIKIDRLVRPAQLATWIDLFTFNDVDGIAALPIPKDSYTNLYTNSGSKSFATSEKDMYALRIETYTNQISNYAGTVLSSSTSTSRAGLAYNIPRKAAVAVAKIKTETKDGKSIVTPKIIASTNVIMPQFGTVAFLEKNQSLANIELDPLSGALRKVILENNAITTDQIKNIGTAAEGIAGLKKDELSDLQSEASRLEQKEKILKLKLSIDSLAKKQN